MRQSVLNAIRQGDWDFEPEPLQEEMFDSTAALPGSEEKVKELAKRAVQGLPLWHSEDRKTYDETQDDEVVQVINRAERFDI
jgi:hypothetical protein